MIDTNNKFDRFLMAVPGILTWTMLLMPVWLGLIAPKIAAFILTYLAVYWVYMAITHGIGLVKGYKIYEKEISIDWYQKCKDLDFKNLPNKATLPTSLDNLKHFILIPTVNEGYQMLSETIETIVNSSFPIKNILLVIGVEEVGEERVKETIEKIKSEYKKDNFPQLMFFVHPKGLPGEIVGVASPNRTWAAKHAVTQLQNENEDIRNYIFTTYDSDWKIHKEFLSRIAYEYLTDEKRFNRFYETVVHLFSNNIWTVPLTSRIEANNVTLGMLSNWTSGHLFNMPKESFSCYSCALDTLVTANFWDTTLIDDTVFYWRAFTARQGDFSEKHFYIPIYGDATGGKNFLNANKNLYRQLVRWGWGSVTTVIALKAILKQANNKKATLEQKILWVYSKIERHLLMRTSAFLITVGFSVVTLVNTTFKNSSTVYGLPQVLSIILTGGLFIFIPATYVRMKLYKGSLPKKWPLWRRFIAVIEGPALMLNLLTFSFIPFLYAETRMMFGELPKTTFYTPKTR
ncbi:hypothetical protein CO058_03465 [candidate division WWE3 bacterium CG_4_9_14_0_2_um_filter_35_11]|uniref:Glycosyltransferase 2-like domain-containing protein n=1 Tax=candidate division WWE3 bacterium CG_4_9_14_0_2_um_filter_35_11 TaxID=1975077 RepID=A0A2M8EL73_UNCKA|nr:MAG: hypothetical protein COV25_00860 [candidate division WWE3 bacterium CG10_big_fil_rev_8_21_14_0_10_35_32]PJC23465.1 MAG: hypothetical protein CO058_03465 [candidate division WWE3 bacterium CG_4_9_14_0_2_um_filter_35_11]